MNFGGAMSGLSAMYPGYVQGRMNENKADMSDLSLDDAKRSALAKVAMGNALAMIGGGQPGGGMQMPGGQGLPTPPPGQQSQPMMPPGGQPGMQPQMRPPMAPGGMQPPPGQPPMMGAGAQPAQGPPGMPPGGARPPMGPQQGGGMQPGALDWRQIVATVQQSNPGIRPDVMAEAVNQFLPMMSQQSQLEWRQHSLQIREQALQDRMQQFMLAEKGRGDRSERTEEGRNVRADKAETGREDRSLRTDERADKNREQRQQQFDKREARLGDALQFRKDSTYQRLEQQKQQAAQRVEMSQGKQGLAELRAAIDAQDKHVRTRIQAYSALNTQTKAERDKLLKEADADYEKQINELKARYGRGGTGTKPAGDKTPKEGEPAPQGNPASVVKSPKPGEVRDGFKFKGGDPAKQESWEPVQ